MSTHEFDNGGPKGPPLWYSIIVAALIVWGAYSLSLYIVEAIK